MGSMKNKGISKPFPSKTSVVAWGIALGFAWTVMPQQATIQADQTVDLAIEDASVDELDLLPDAEPGFELKKAEPEFQEQIAQFKAFVAEKDWAKAFRLLTELDSEQLQMLAPLEDGLHVLVKEDLQKQLLSLPPEGRRAFQLYFDAQAAEQFDKVKNHPLPGSSEQLTLLQELVDRMLASSSGGEAAVLLGDMYFGRGLFEKADRSWQLALEQGSATGQEALELQAKRVLALQRAGQQAEAQTLLGELQDRYGQAKMTTGGKEVDVLAMLGQTLEQPQAPDPQAVIKNNLDNLLPTADAFPHWHLSFIDNSTRNAVNQVRSRSNGYGPPNDLMKFVPPVVADAHRVYFQWVGVVFAMDKETGKIAWVAGSLEETANSFTNRVQSHQGDPRNYRMAISDDMLLVTTTQSNNYDSPFVLKAYDAQTGQMRWTSDSRQDWTLAEADKPQQVVTSVVGQVLDHEGKAYAVVHRTKQTELFLRRFSPQTGEVDWTIPLGGAQAITFQYPQVSRMPQPTLAMGSSLLYVMTNNGAVLAVDMIAGEVKWAVRTYAPFGIGYEESNRGWGSRLGMQLQKLANTNGSGNLLLQDNTLYAKEHNSKTLYALNPSSGKLKWSADQLKPDAKLIGVDEKRFYVMDSALQSYDITGNHDLITKNGTQTGSPDHAGTIMLKDKVLLYANGKLRQLDTTHLDPAGKYENPDYLGQRGGHLYLFDDLLVAIDTAQITAFKIPNKQP
jgi:outer membrane protein assembly factor BamB